MLRQYHIHLRTTCPKTGQNRQRCVYCKARVGNYTNNYKERFVFTDRNDAISAMVENVCQGVTSPELDWVIQVMDNDHREVARVTRCGKEFVCVIHPENNTTLSCGRCGCENLICLQCDEQVQ